MQKQKGSNLRPSVLETDILPTELCSHRWGGGTRTHEAEWRQIYSLLSLPLENTSLKKRRLRDSNPWGVLPPSGFQDQCNRPTLPNLQFAEAEGFEPPKPFGFTRSCSGKRLLRRRASSVSPYHSAILPLVFGCKGTIPLCSLSA